MTDTDDDPTVDPEDGVCVCCHAASRVRHCIVATWRPEVCNECLDDGTYRTWVAGQIEAIARACRWVYRADKHGKKPAAAKPA